MFCIYLYVFSKEIFFSKPLETVSDFIFYFYELQSFDFTKENIRNNPSISLIHHRYIYIYIYIYIKGSSRQAPDNDASVF